MNAGKRVERSFVRRATLGTMWVVTDGQPYTGPGTSGRSAEGFRHWADAIEEANRRACGRMERRRRS